MTSGRPPPKIIVEKHENYRTIIQSGVFGGHRPGFFEWIVYTDEISAEDALSTIPPDSAKLYIKRTLQCRLILSPVQAKILYEWLGEHIRKYEEIYGKIITPKELKKSEKIPPGTVI